MTTRRSRVSQLMWMDSALLWLVVWLAINTGIAMNSIPVLMGCKHLDIFIFVKFLSDSMKVQCLKICSLHKLGVNFSTNRLMVVLGYW